MSALQSIKSWRRSGIRIGRQADYGGGTSEEFLSGIGKGDRLHPQLSIVLYYGEERWDSPLRLKDMMPPFPCGTEALFFDYGINLVQIIDSEHYSFHNEAVRTVFEGAGALLRGDLDFIN